MTVLTLLVTATILPPRDWHHFAARSSASRGPSWAVTASDSLGPVALALALTASAADTKHGRRFFQEAADASLWTGLFTQVLKLATRVPRPLSPDSRDSFPSGHTSAAFALATVLSHEYPRGGPIWYGWACAVGVSRVVLQRHRPREVIAGAVIGIATALWVLNDDDSVTRNLQRSWRWGSAEIEFGPRMHSRGVSLLRAEW